MAGGDVSLKLNGLEVALVVANVVIAITSIAVIFIPDMLLYVG